MNCLHMAPDCTFVFEFGITHKAAVPLPAMSLLVIPQTTEGEKAMLTEITSKWKHSILFMTLIHVPLVQVGTAQMYIAKWALI